MGCAFISEKQQTLLSAAPWHVSVLVACRSRAKNRSPSAKNEFFRRKTEKRGGAVTQILDGRARCAPKRPLAIARMTSRQNHRVPSDRNGSLFNRMYVYSQNRNATLRQHRLGQVNIYKIRIQTSQGADQCPRPSKWSEQAGGLKNSREYVPMVVQKVLDSFGYVLFLFFQVRSYRK